MDIEIFAISLLLSILLGSVAVPLLSKTNTTQTVLHYVKEHGEKNGTPTMGGLIFILVICIVGMIATSDRVVRFCILIGSASGFVGLLDDVAKVRFGKNLGLRPYQKIISQIAIAGIFAYFVYSSTGGEMWVPFISKNIDFGVFSLPILFVAFVATSNTVNLTDGLDGLASFSCLASVGLLWIFSAKLAVAGVLSLGYQQYIDFANLCGIMIFALLGFLLFNTSKASVFMGDVGSLFLGGILCALFCVSGLTLYLLVFGLPFVISGLSDILQVGYFKLTGGKRIFLMAPYHHHLQRKGYSETKICMLYFVVTTAVGLCTISFF